MNSDATYAVATASPESVYTRTDDDILDPEIRRVDGSIQWKNCANRITFVFVRLPPVSLSGSVGP